MSGEPEELAKAILGTPTPASGLTRGVLPAGIVRGVVQDVDNTELPWTVSVTLAGSDQQVDNIAYLVSNYSPTVGDNVTLLVTGSDYLVIGSQGAGTGPGGPGGGNPDPGGDSAADIVFRPDGINNNALTLQNSSIASEGLTILGLDGQVAVSPTNGGDLTMSGDNFIVRAPSGIDLRSSSGDVTLNAIDQTLALGGSQVIFKSLDASPVVSELEATDFAVWLDPTPGATQLNVTAKDANGLEVDMVVNTGGGGGGGGVNSVTAGTNITVSGTSVNPVVNFDPPIAESSVTGLVSDLAAKATDSAVVHNALVTTKGDLIAASGSSTPVRVGVGTDGYVLTADSTQTSGVGWQVSGGGGGGANIPVGAIFMFPSTYSDGLTPTGWLLCDGSTFNATTYPTLHSYLGTTTLPNLKGVTPMGAGANGVVLGTRDASGSSPAHTHTSAAHSHSHNHAGPAHTHTGPNHNHSHNHAGLTHSHGHNHGPNGGGSFLTNRTSGGGLTGVAGSNYPGDSTDTDATTASPTTDTDATNAGTGATGSSGSGNTATDATSTTPGATGSSGSGSVNLPPQLGVDFYIRSL